MSDDRREGCEWCGGPLPDGSTERRRFCSPNCRVAAWRADGPVEALDDVPAGGNLEALDQMLERVGLEVEDRPLAQACRSLAVAVDSQPTSGALWGRYLTALGELRAAVVGREDRAFQEALEALRQAGGRSAEEMGREAEE